MSKDNGGAAFPSHGTMGEVVCEGMALRDYFAAKALSGMLNNPSLRNNDESISYAEAIAVASYIMADAMLAERAK